MAEPYIQLDAGEATRDLADPKARSLAAKAVLTIALLALGLVALGGSLQPRARSSSLSDNGPVRTFKYFTEEDARELLSEGVSDPNFAPGGEMIRTLTDSVNSAMLRIRGALLDSGEPQAPFVTPAPPGVPKFGNEVAGEDAQWWVPRDAHPGVYKLAMLGGVCGGKTAGSNYLKKALPARGLLTVAVPEVATVLFNLGVMNYGSHVPYNGVENKEFFVQQLLLQLVLEELFGRAAEQLLAMHPQERAVIMLTDRDATGGKVFTRPLVPTSDIWWPDVLAKAGWLLGRPTLTDRDLTWRYQLGAVVLQSMAVVDGHLNVEKYKEICLGPDGSNPVRSESAAAAKVNDETVTEGCEETYPPEAVCRVTNTWREGFDQKLQHLLHCVTERVDSLYPQGSPGLAN